MCRWAAIQVWRTSAALRHCTIASPTLTPSQPLQDCACSLFTLFVGLIHQYAASLRSQSPFIYLSHFVPSAHNPTMISALLLAGLMHLSPCLAYTGSLRALLGIRNPEGESESSKDMSHIQTTVTRLCMWVVPYQISACLQGQRQPSRALTTILNI